MGARTGSGLCIQPWQHVDFHACEPLPESAVSHWSEIFGSLALMCLGLAIGGCFLAALLMGNLTVGLTGICLFICTLPLSAVIPAIAWWQEHKQLKLRAQIADCCPQSCATSQGLCCSVAGRGESDSNSSWSECSPLEVRLEQASKELSEKRKNKLVGYLMHAATAPIMIAALAWALCTDDAIEGKPLVWLLRIFGCGILALTTLIVSFVIKRHIAKTRKIRLHQKALAAFKALPTGYRITARREHLDDYDPHELKSLGLQRGARVIEDYASAVYPDGSRNQSLVSRKCGP